MKSKLNRASAIAVTATFLTALVGAEGSGAIAQDNVPVAIPAESQSAFISRPVVQPLPSVSPEVATVDAEADAAGAASSLGELVAAHGQPEQLSNELQCLAGAIYFEAKGESLPGQLAVGRVIVARSKSGRFPGSYCGVVYQPSQFSFIRGRAMPAINTNSQYWRQAVAIAQIADSGSWRSPVEGALFFHAARVSPGWRMSRMGRVDNHVFYR